MIVIAALKLICCSIIKLHNAIAWLELFLSLTSISFSNFEIKKTFSHLFLNTQNAIKRFELFNLLITMFNYMKKLFLLLLLSNMMLNSQTNEQDKVQSAVEIFFDGFHKKDSILIKSVVHKVSVSTLQA